MTYDGDAVSFAADVYTANQEVRREREAVKYWRTEYLRVQRERDEWRRIACEDDDDKPALPQREGDYL